jgi:hypothetical protein
MNKLNVKIALEHLECTRTGESNGAEPYLWTIFFKLDGSTAELKILTNKDKLDLGFKGKKYPGDILEFHFGKGSHKNVVASSIYAPTKVAIPTNVGVWETTIEQINWEIDRPFIFPAIIGVVIIPFEEDATSNSIIDAAYGVAQSKIVIRVNEFFSQGLLEMQEKILTFKNEFNNKPENVENQITSDEVAAEFWLRKELNEIKKGIKDEAIEGIIWSTVAKFLFFEFGDPDDAFKPDAENSQDFVFRQNQLMDLKTRNIEVNFTEEKTSSPTQLRITGKIEISKAYENKGSSIFPSLYIPKGKEISSGDYDAKFGSKGYQGTIIKKEFIGDFTEILDYRYKNCGCPPFTAKYKKYLQSTNKEYKVLKWSNSNFAYDIKWFAYDHANEKVELTEKSGTFKLGLLDDNSEVKEVEVSYTINNGILSLTNLLNKTTDSLLNYSFRIGAVLSESVLYGDSFESKYWVEFIGELKEYEKDSENKIAECLKESGRCIQESIPYEIFDIKKLFEPQPDPREVITGIEVITLLKHFAQLSDPITTINTIEKMRKNKLQF